MIPISTYDTGKADDLYYGAMNFIHGESLQNGFPAKARCSNPPAHDLALCAANALKFAWNNEQLIPRDIKPDNLIIDSHGNVKLCDRGLAEYLGESTLLSLSGQVFGTPTTCPPNQSAPTSARSG
jgi:serine/threonine-protein kinase